MRGKLTGRWLLATLAVTVVTGCSSATPLTPTGSSQLTSSGSISSPAEPAATVSRAAGSSADVLSAECSAAIDAQVGIADLFSGPVDGRTLTAADVMAVFDAISPDLPKDLTADIATLHDAADRAVKQSDVTVASILAEQKVSDATEALSSFVRSCNPVTSN